jgi:hypothetical protein
MDIRKIIREEMSDFDWMKNANILSYEYLVGKAIEFDPIIQDTDYFKYVTDILEGLGFILPEDLKYPDEFFDWDYDGLVGLFMNTNGHIIWTSDISEDYDEHIADYLGKSVGEVEILDGRQLFKNYVKEDFDWAESWVDDTPNVGDEYYWDYGMGNGPVLIRVISIINTPGREPIVRFKVMDRNFIDDNPEMFYDEDYGWDPTDSIGFEGFMEMAKRNMNEDLNWVIDVNPLKHGHYYIDARDLSRKERIELQRKLLNLGFRWDDSSSGGPDQVNTWAMNTLQGYTTDGSKNRIYYSIKPYDGVTKPWLTYLSYDEFLNLINKNINENFDWTEKVEPDYWNPEDNPLQVGDCIIDKLDSTSTKWTIKSFGQSLGGTPIIEVENDVYFGNLSTKKLNRELFEKDLVKGRYSFCDDFIKEDFDWVEEHNPIEYLVDKAFYFDPPADGAQPDSEEVKAYNKICQMVVEAGGQSVYHTPTTLEPDEDLVHGLYVYTSKNSGELSFCFTPGIDEEESYEIHIKEFAKDEAENTNIQVVDAVEFVKSL